MNLQQYQELETVLKENGYRNGGSAIHCNADHYWYKSYGKENNPYEENRSLYQILLNVYDWRKYADRDPIFKTKEFSISVSILVSRTVNESVYLNFDLSEDTIDFDDLENKAHLFYQYVNNNFKIE